MAPPSLPTALRERSSSTLTGITMATKNTTTRSYAKVSA